VSDDEAAALLGVSRSHLERMPDLPPAFRVGERLKRRWSDAWMDYVKHLPRIEDEPFDREPFEVSSLAPPSAPAKPRLRMAKKTTKSKPRQRESHGRYLPGSMR
jgi:hypothetical protein